MKSIVRIPLCLLVLALASCKDSPTAKQTASGGHPDGKAEPESAAQPEVSNNGFTHAQLEFLNLDKEKRADFARHLGDAIRLFDQKNISECLAALDDASAIFRDSPEVHNIRGACYIEKRGFDRALEEFESAAALAPNNPSIEFNIGEVYFVTKQWQKALDSFEKLIPKQPTQQVHFCRLVEFKIMLCKKQLGRNDEALALAGKYDTTDNSPFPWYAKAVSAFEAKNPDLAEEWLESAARKFSNTHELAPWQDTLIEYGYMVQGDL